MSQTYSKGDRRYQSCGSQVTNDDEKGENGSIYLRFSLKSFFKRVQGLEPVDYQAQVNFITWFLQQTAVDLDFCAHMLLVGECTFSGKDILNIQNYNAWAMKTHAQ